MYQGDSLDISEAKSLLLKMVTPERWDPPLSPPCLQYAMVRWPILYLCNANTSSGSMLEAIYKHDVALTVDSEEQNGCSADQAHLSMMARQMRSTLGAHIREIIVVYRSILKDSNSRETAPRRAKFGFRDTA